MDCEHAQKVSWYQYLEHPHNSGPAHPSLFIFCNTGLAHMTHLICAHHLIGTFFFLLTHKLSDTQFAWIHTDHINSLQSVHSYTFTWHTCNHAQITKRDLAWKNELKENTKREEKKLGTFPKLLLNVNSRWGDIFTHSHTPSFCHLSAPLITSSSPESPVEGAAILTKSSSCTKLTLSAL